MQQRAPARRMEQAMQQQIQSSRSKGLMAVLALLLPVLAVHVQRQTRHFQP